MPEEISYTGGEEIRPGATVERGEVRPIKRISWPAVFGGTMVALGTVILFLFFGLAIGFIIGSPGGAAAWSIIWYLVTSIVALYVGGWVAARLSGNPDRGAASLHGLVTWGLTMLATFVFLGSSVWEVLRATANVLAATMTTQPGQAAAAQVQPPSNLAQTVGQAGWVFAIVLFGGVLLAAIASWVGGAKGRPSSTARL